MEGYRPYTDLLNDGSYAEETQFFGGQQTDASQTPIVDSTPSSKTSQKQKGKNFIVDEDELLVSAWLNVSTDPKQGTNQTKATFWTRVHTYYQFHRRTLSERSQGSLLHRWGGIQEAVSKFCGYLAGIERRNQSGVTTHDKVQDAEKMFKELEKQKSFQFKHCWLMLRNQPKWHEKLHQLEEQKASNKKQKLTKNSSPRTSTNVNGDGSNEDTGKDVTPGSKSPQRPMGKKKAKESSRRGGSDACIQALDMLWEKKKSSDADKEIKKDERYAQTFALDQQRLELEKRRLQLDEKKLANEQLKLANDQMKLVNEANALHAKKMAEEDRIMSMDTTFMNDIQREYYSHKQAEIMACRMRNSE